MKKIHKVKRPGTMDFPTRILQFGGGNFLRGFSCWMIQYLNENSDFRGNITLIKPTPGTYPELEEQGGYYHLWLKGVRDGKLHDEISLIRAIDHLIYPYEDFDSYLSLSALNDVRFVISNTTESGITYRREDQFSDRPAISFPGKICQLLKARFDFCMGDRNKGYIFLPCELTENNGDLLKEYVLRHAVNWNLGVSFLEWIQEANIFCNTLVDRIVTGKPTETDYREFMERTGYEDNALVVGEYYHLWVIDGPSQVKKELPLDEAGLQVIFANSLAAYRTRKVRILNGAHTSMVALGLTKGFQYVGEIIRDPDMVSFLETMLREEVMPTIDELPQGELENYRRDIFERFQNPYIKHRLRSIALNSVSKFEVRLLPVINDYLKKFQKLPDKLLIVWAALIWFYIHDNPEDNPDLINQMREVAKESKITNNWMKAILTPGRFWINVPSHPDLVDRVSDYYDQYQ